LEEGFDTFEGSQHIVLTGGLDSLYLKHNLGSFANASRGADIPSSPSSVSRRHQPSHQPQGNKPGSMPLMDFEES